MRAVYLTALLIAAVTATPPLHKPSLSVSLNAKLQGAVSVNGAEWLQFAGGLGVHANGQYRACTAAKGTPHPAATPQDTDRLGKHTGKTSFDFECAGARVTVAARSYGAATTVLSFKLTGGNISMGSAGGNQPVVGFPAFALDGGRLPELGWAWWHGLWPNLEAGPASAGVQALHRVPARHDGPVLFTGPAGANAGALLVAPLDDPLNTVFTAPSRAAQAGAGKHGAKKAGALLAFGPSGALARLDEGYGYQIALVAAPGATAAFEAYGALLRKQNGVEEHATNIDKVLAPWPPAGSRLPDPMVSKLSLWTDNGAWLFCDPNSQRSLPAALTALRAQNLTVDVLQLDGWWMNKTVFKANDEDFPDWPAFRAAIGMDTKLVLYKAFFGRNDVLLNKFNRVESPKGPWYPAADDAEPFFTELFAQGKAIGLASYEVDFMSDHWIPTPALANTTSGLPTYLGGLAAAGAKRGVPMQWCMPTTGIVLFAASCPAVSNARATVDYAVEDEIANWRENYARPSFAEHLIATKALRCTATARMLIVAQCSANP